MGNIDLYLTPLARGSVPHGPGTRQIGDRDLELAALLHNGIDACFDQAAAASDDRDCRHQWRDHASCTSNKRAARSMWQPTFDGGLDAARREATIL